MILLAKEIAEGRVEGQPALGLMDITARRNAFGRQVDSFETNLQVPALGNAPFHAVFIRAPQIDKVGAEVETLASLDDGRIVAARQGKLLATAFHPELTGDARFHQLFLSFLNSSLTPQPPRPLHAGEGEPPYRGLTMHLRKPLD